MQEIFCPSCRLKQPTEHTYCVSCGVPLPSHLLEDTSPGKVARFFAGIKVAGQDPENGFLRVSCYLRDHTISTEEGSISVPGDHVRFSMWVDSEAKCVMSLPSSEAREMAGFILSQLGSETPLSNV